MIFGSSYREDRKKWGSRNQNSTEVILKHPDFNRRREMHDIKETVNCFSYEKFGEILNRHFACGAIQIGSFQSRHRNKSLGSSPSWSSFAFILVIAVLMEITSITWISTIRISLTYGFSKTEYLQLWIL